MTLLEIIFGAFFGILAYVCFRALLMGFFTVAPNERAVLTSFSKAQRIGNATTSEMPFAEALPQADLERYNYPQLVLAGRSPV